MHIPWFRSQKRKMEFHTLLQLSIIYAQLMLILRFLNFLTRVSSLNVSICKVSLVHIYVKRRCIEQPVDPLRLISAFLFNAAIV